MSTITPEMVQVFNERLGALGSPWRIHPLEYGGAIYSAQPIVGPVNPTLAPMLVDNLSYTNGGSLEQQVVLKVNKTQKLISSFSYKNIFKIGGALKFSFKVGIISTEAQADFSYTRDETKEDTHEDSIAFDFEVPVRVPPRTRVRLQTILKVQTVTDLPFELHVVLSGGKFGVVPKDNVPLYRYSSSEGHFYTTDYRELGEGRDGWVKDGIACFVSSTQGPSMVPLYRYFLDDKHHFYTTDYNERGADGLLGIQCYVYPGPTPGAIPLYRYFEDGGDHFYTVDYNELGSGRDGWRLQGVQAHVIPTNLADPSLLRDVGALFPNDSDRRFVIPGHYRGQATNRDIDILLLEEPALDPAVAGKQLVERTSDQELTAMPILSEEMAIKVSPGTLVDLTKPRTKPAPGKEKPVKRPLKKAG